MSVTSSVRESVVAENLGVPSGINTVVHVASAVVLYGALFAVAHAISHPLVWVIVWGAQAFLLAGAGAMMHECAHYNLYRSRLANRVTGLLAGGALLLVSSTYRAYHLQHHVETCTKDDPEGEPPVLTARWQYFVLMPIGGLLFLSQLWIFTLRTVVGRPPAFVRTAAQRRAIRIDAAVLAVIYALVIGLLIREPRAVVTLWLAPLAITLVCVFPLLLAPEHWGGKGDDTIENNTRTVRSNRALRWVFWNNNFHTAHHLIPAVPSRNLPRLHELVADDIAWNEASYIRFHAALVRGLGRQPSSAEAHGK